VSRLLAVKEINKYKTMFATLEAQDRETRRLTLQEVGEGIKSASKWTEQASDRWIGNSDSTGGPINLSEKYLLVPLAYIESLLKGEKPE